jgi:hypothetical protein
VLYQDADDVAFLTIRNCRLGGASQARAYQVVMEADTVDGGVAWAVHYVWIEHCWFRGGPGRAIELTDLPRPGLAAHNRIEGYDTGMYVEDGDYYRIEQNTILRCGTGIALSSGTIVGVVDNEIRDCGVGVDVYMGDNLHLLRNRIIGARGSGIFALWAGLVVEQNVIGQCRGDGIVLDDVGPTWESERTVVRGNTILKNGGAGISVTPSFYGVSVERNIVFANAGWGLTVPPGADVVLACNDWYGNGGAVSGVAASPTDLSVDPLFCGVDSADVRLDSGSPLADTAGCGQIGALGVGCGVTATLVQRFTAARVGEGIRVIWQVAEGATASAVWLERSEALEGGAWLRPLTVRSFENRAVVELDRGAAPDRTYAYRLVALEGSGVTVIGAPIVVEADARPEFRLVEVGPNPGSGPLRIAFSLQHAAEVAIDIFDVQGRRVASAGGGAWPAGTHAVAWDGRTRTGELAPAGIYLVRYVYPGGQDRRTIVRIP